MGKMRIPAENVKMIAFQGCDFAHIFSNISESILSTSEFYGVVINSDGTALADLEVSKTTGGILVTMGAVETAGIPEGTYEYAIIQTQSDATVKMPFIVGFLECRKIPI